MVMMDATLKNVQNCPNCGVANPNLRYAAHVPYSYISHDHRPCWIIYQCSSCNDVVAALGAYEISGLDNYKAVALARFPQLAKKTIPDVRTVNNDLPERSRVYLAQAISSLNAPDGAVMLAGSAVDAMLKQAGYEEGTVYQRITKAVDDHVLTPSMAEWAHAVRIESNKPRHADVDQPHATKELAEQAISFAEALGEYLFALPARIERGKVAADEATTQQSSEIF
jgi:Domain of unknown function (DUF4145)